MLPEEKARIKLAKFEEHIANSRRDWIEKETLRLVKSYDKARANYYHYHTCQKWGEFSNYNLAINSSYISDEAAADLIVEYMKTRTYK